MIRAIFVSIILLFLAIASKAFELSPQAQISLLTCDPGKELYSSFGHNAIRVSDPVQGVDYVFNYGTFSFNTPHFYLKFLRGKLDYQLAVTQLSYFMQEYTEDNRSVRELVLNLTPAQKQAIFNFLSTNYLPGNRFYRYQFFYDNCATRIRDLFPKALQSDFAFHEPKPQSDKSFRDLVHSYLPNSPWSDLALNLGLARPTDNIMDSMEYMFIPDYVEKAFLRATVVKDGKSEPFVFSQKVLFQAVPEVGPYQLIRPWTVFFLLASIFLLISILEIKKSKNIFILDALVFIVVGLLGTVQLLLWTATEHAPCFQNWNLLWALPSHVVFGAMLFRNKIVPVARKYFLISGAIAFITLILAMFDLAPQHFDKSLGILILILVVRSLRLGWPLRA